MSYDPQAATVPAWREALEVLVAQRMHEPFAWGRNDCCLFAADAVQAMTGTDPAAPWRGSYATAAEALALVASLGGMPAIGALGGTACPPLMAQVGDVGLVNDGERDVLAVCVGSVWLMPVAAGLGALPLAAATMAWRVAHD